MDEVLAELLGHFAKATYVQEVEVVIDTIAASPRTRVIANQFFSEVTEADLARLTGAADEWFNFAMSAARARNYGAYEKILLTALEKHPESVDLYCEWFQFCYGHKSRADAQDAREKLEALGRDNTAGYWRYWCYNAMFESQYLGNKEEAARLLDTALTVVPPAGMLNVYRQYRVVLIDGRERPSLSDDKPTDPADLLKRVDEKYKEGLSRGIEDGYVLAIARARLLREQTSGMKPEAADAKLGEVLDLLDVAERTYTDDPNHPLWDIYREKAITLMARRRYEDALQIFKGIPEYLFNDSLRLMAEYAANMTGQEFRPAGQQAASEGDGRLAQRVDALEARLTEVDALEAKLMEKMDGLEQVLSQVISALYKSGQLGDMGAES
jgi:tetratricopeptide (TPR) repeat protein